MDMKMRMMFRCPHCKARCYVRTSVELSDLTRELMFLCTDVECAHSFVVRAEAVKTLSPSGKPDPSIYLPMAENVRKRVAAHASLSHNPEEGVRVLNSAKCGKSTPIRC